MNGLARALAFISLFASASAEELKVPGDQVIEIGDQAVGVSVLRELYDEMVRPVMVDLGSLWRQLGIRRHGKTVIFDDSAPLADVRTAITASQ